MKCDGPITSDECRIAIGKMSINKAPGITGFTAEFFKAFWNDLGAIIVLYINAARDDNFFITQRRGVITLIPKKGEQNNLQNKRPICLLDVIYKIVAKVIAMRINSVIRKLVSNAQTGYIKGRYIGENLRLVSDVIEYCQTDSINGVIIACDYQAAFDSLEHEFLFLALKAYNFGDDLIRWVKLLYRDSNLTIVNNGYTSPWFSCSRGTFQGSPISGIMFALAVEVLACNLRNENTFHGIEISGEEIKISLYADDITLFAKDLPSAERALEKLDLFSKASGLFLNVSKSHAMWVGPSKGSSVAVRGIEVRNKIKILGIWFSANDSCVTDNVEKIYKKIEGTINVWNQRSITIKGRITISKSLLASQLVYACSCVSIPRVYLQKIQSKIMRFLWRGRPPKVAKQILMQSIGCGGLNAVNVELFCRSLQISWIKRMALNTDSAWRKLLQARIGRYDLLDLIRTSLDFRQVNSFRIPQFYKYSLFEAQKFTQIPLDQAQNVRKEMLWYNKNICISRKPVFINSMYSVGIKTINDLIRDDGMVYNLDELRTKFPGIRIDFLRFAALVRAIPQTWKTLIASGLDNRICENERNDIVIFQFHTKRKSINEICSSDFYHAEVGNTSPKAIAKWENEGNSPGDWAESFKIPYRCTKSTKLQTLHYRVMHRYLPTRRFLYVRKVIDSPACKYCNEIDTIVHFLYECRTVINIWERVFQSLNIRSENHMKDALFGILHGRIAHNLIILIVKQYIVTCKLSGQNRRITYEGLKATVNHYLEGERLIAYKDNKIDSFNDKWQHVIDDNGEIAL